MFNLGFNQVQSKEEPKGGCSMEDNIYKTVNQLKMEIDQWEDQENLYVDRGKTADWIQKGIVLYEKLLNLEPKNNFCRYRLANLYLDQGTDIKLHGGPEKYQEAQKVLKKALRYNKEDALIYYRLGFLSFYEGEFLQSAVYFDSFLKYYEKCRDSVVTEEKYYRAKCKLVLSCKKYHDRIKQELDIVYPKIEDPKIVSILEELQDSTFLDKENDFLYIAFDKENGRIDLTWDDYKSLSVPSQNEIVFDLINPLSPTFKTTLGEQIIGPQQSKLLILLMLSNDLVPPWKIGNKLKLSSVPIYIKRLRERLKTCFNENIKDVIQEGYQFKWPGNYRVILNIHSIPLYDEIINEY
jgi:tetratricopeptide (TPR) repeat protein